MEELVVHIIQAANMTQGKDWEVIREPPFRIMKKV